MFYIENSVNRYSDNFRIFDKTRKMETVQIDILNPKAKALLKSLADLNLIRIKKVKVKSELKEVLDVLRRNSDETPSLEEITAEVESVRKNRYDK